MIARKHNRIVTVAAGDLKIHPTAQRRIVPAQLNRRMADLDLDAIGVLHGAEIDGVTYIIDGQHRVMALQRHGFGEWKVRVELHDDARDPARASELFLELNARATVSAFDLFINAVAAGDSVACGVERILKAHGLAPSRQHGDGCVAAVTACSFIYRWDDGKTLEETIQFQTETFGTNVSALEGKLIEGTALVFQRHNGALDKTVLQKKLRKYAGGGSGILGDAKGLRKIRRASLPRCVAEIIVETYNVGRRGESKLPVS